ncbi:MAG: hypothetical protein HQM09_12745 [Candidatus Riflebacteria bacterium]|nr:hypothetical protein [Candidatus Riflebacteria bacterium]
MATRWIGPDTGEETRFVLILLLLLCFAFSVGGCRRGPSSETASYERERDRLASRPPVEKETERYLPDRYPWEGHTSQIPGITDRLKDTDAKLEAEKREVDQTLHGPCRVYPPLLERVPRIPYCPYGFCTCSGGRSGACTCYSSCYRSCCQ